MTADNTDHGPTDTAAESQNNHENTFPYHFPSTASYGLVPFGAAAAEPFFFAPVRRGKSSAYKKFLLDNGVEQRTGVMIPGMRS